MVEPPVTASDSSVVIATDCPCLKCGYNLRTLPCDGACPECGEPVQVSLAGGPFGFAALRDLRRLRLGIACWILAIAATALVYVYVVLVIFASASFWQALSQRGSLPSRFYYWSWRTYFYADFSSPLLQAAALSLVVISDPRARQGRRRWLTMLIAGTALVSAAGSLALGIMAYGYPGAFRSLMTSEKLARIATFLLQAATLVGWLGLTTWIARTHRKLRWLFWTVFAGLAVQLVTSTSASLLTLFGSGPTFLGRGVYAFGEMPAWEVLLRTCISFVQQNAQEPVSILLCLALWAILRRVNRAIAAFRR